MMKDIAKFYDKYTFLYALEKPKYYFNNISIIKFYMLLYAIQKFRSTVLEIMSNSNIVLRKIKTVNQEQFNFFPVDKNIKSHANSFKKILRMIITVFYCLI